MQNNIHAFTHIHQHIVLNSPCALEQEHMFCVHWPWNAVDWCYRDFAYRAFNNTSRVCFSIVEKRNESSCYIDTCNLYSLLIFTAVIGRSSANSFYPRPVLAFGYCRCLRLSVCVRPCVIHKLVRVITHHPFQLGSPNLDQRCKRPWLRSLIFVGRLIVTFKVKLNSKVKIYPILSLSMP